MRGISKERTEVINFRCTPAEKKAIYEKASLLGMTVSAFLVFEAVGEEIGQAIADSVTKKRNKTSAV